MVDNLSASRLRVSRHVRRPRLGMKLAFPSSVRLITVACLAGAGTTASAIEFNGSVGYEATYSDNVTNDRSGESDWRHVPQVQFHALHESSSYSIDAEYRAEHRVYARDTFPDDTLVSGRTLARVALLPNALDWTLSHSSTEEPVNSRRADTPDNSQTSNVLATGPQFHLRLDSRTEVGLGASFQQVTAARSSNDSQRWTGNGRVDRALDGATRVGLSVQHSDIDYDSDFGQDYRSTDVRLTGSRDQGERTHLQIEVGGVFVKTEDRPVPASGGGFVNEGGDDDFNWTGLLEIDHELMSSLRATFRASRRVSDSGSDLGAGVATADIAAAGRSDERQSSLQEEVELSLERTGGRLTTRVGVSAYRQEFQSGTREDEERRRLSLGGRYSIGPRLSLNASMAIEAIEFQDADGDDQRRSASMRLQWAPWRSLALNGGVTWVERDGARATSDSYDETKVILGVTYDF